MHVVTMSQAKKLLEIANKPQNLKCTWIHLALHLMLSPQ